MYRKYWTSIIENSIDAATKHGCCDYNGEILAPSLNRYFIVRQILES